ncbi:ABC transporter ATP-binding protein [Blautia sp. Sow4_E7]|uniref:ABC transporter ATP-binding protein n=1 Tax=Blautia sp. Sow4_E7 TaxID=3438749 RepID=UPI003F8F0060
MKRLLKYAGPYKKDMILGALLVLIETCFELFIPIMIADLIDVGVANHDLSYIYVKGVQMIFCALMALITGLLYAQFAAKAAYGWGAEIRKAEYAKVQQYAFSNLDHFLASSLITRMTTDVTVLQNMVNAGFRPVTRGPSLLVMGILLSFWISPRLAVVFLVCIPVLGVVLFWIVTKVAPMYTRLQGIMDRLNRVVQEGLTAIRAVKAFVRDEYEEEKFGEVNTNLTSSSETTFHYAVLNLPAFQSVMYSAIVLIMWFGGNMILKSNLAVGDLTGFLSYVMQIMNSLMMIANVFLLLTRSLASAHRIAEVLDEDVELTSPKNGIGEVADGRIEFENVSFKYHKDAREYALSGVKLQIPSGQTVGILGGTGASKTTLVQLIPRLYDATEGVVKVAGKDVREYDLHALRDAVGIILQKNVLFFGTVRDNLRWGNPQATDGEIWEACKTACADEFLSCMPEGLDSMLEQGAGNLSGGQKQRLCIARALVGKAKILIFDDSTSAVDTATEKKIREALAARKDVTKIIIAQRITSVMNTDQIVILEDGKVHSTGQHKELLAHDPIYQEIYRSQMRGEQENAIEEHGQWDENRQMPDAQERFLQKDASCVEIKGGFVSEVCERRGE